MAKRKAEFLTQGGSETGVKKVKHEEAQVKKVNLLDDSDSGSSDDESVGGVKLDEPGFKINNEYAKRFEHNSKREELQRRQSNP
jgi:protein KRI1